MDIEELNRAPMYLAPNAVMKDILDSKDGVPEWLQLTPSRGRFEGRDGRRFNIKSPRAIVSAFNESGEDIQLDIDHKSEMPAMFTDTGSAAVGWVTELATRNGGQIWAKVEWTPQGEDLIRNRTFRGLSPVFRVTRESRDAFLDDPGKNAMEVTAILSVALTNRPNLRLKSLNTAGQPVTGQSEMNLEQLLKALGLPEGSDEATAMNAISELKARPERVEPAAPIDITQYVPRADFDQLNTQVSTLQGKLAERDAQDQANAKAAHQANVDRAITEALKAGKISPASEAYHRATCADEAGLARFHDYVKTVAPIVAPNASEAPDEIVSVEVPDERLQALAAEHGVPVETLQAERDRLRAAGEIQ